jgi:hypothetical protein
MVMVRPTEVRFGSVVIGRAQSVRVDRHARRVVTEWDDAGPHAAMCDVAQQETRVVVRAAVFAEDVELLDDARVRLGTQAQLRVVCKPNASDAGRRTLVVERAVLVGVRHEVGREGGRGETSAGSGAVAVRELEFVGVGQSGAEDPVVVT